jgi:hypothetical protein
MAGVAGEHNACCCNVGQDNRIWHCTTRDFGTYSQPALFFDPGSELQFSWPGEDLHAACLYSWIRPPRIP